MTKKKVVFLGGKSIGAYCLKQLLTHAAQWQLEIVAVATKKNSALDGEETVALLAEQAQIACLEHLDDLPSCDFIISVQYHKILKQKHIDQAKVLALNLHMAPLPEYRGCNQFSFAIIDQKTIFGTTLHEMTTGIDDGAILAERRFEIAQDIWVEDLYQKTLAESKILFTDEIEHILYGKYEAVSQESLLEERGTNFHYRNEIKTLKQIGQDWPEEKKKRYVRATFMSGFEPPYSLINGEKKYYDKSSF